MLIYKPPVKIRPVLPQLMITPNADGGNVLSACPAVLANDPNYLANDSRACAGSGISVSVGGQATLGINSVVPSVR